MNAYEFRKIAPIWANAEDPYFEPPKMQARHLADEKLHRAKLKYGLSIIILFVWAATMMIGCIVTGVIVRHNVWIDARAEYDEQLELYKQQQAEQAQAEHWLSGDASREAHINQEIQAVAPVISKLNTDLQKYTEASCMLARVMNPSYPSTFKEVANQKDQWMFYDGSDLTYSQRDWEIAEEIIRPYIEDGIIPARLTSAMVYAEWSTNDYILRDSYQTTSSMHTWQYGG